LFRLFRLRCLNLAWTNLSVESVQFLCENIPRCIEQLNLSGQRYQITDDRNDLNLFRTNNLRFLFVDIQSLVRRALRLRVLDLSDSLLLTDQSIISIRQYSRLLTHLSVSRCYLFTPATLMSVDTFVLHLKTDLEFLFSTLKLPPAFSALDIFGTLAQIPLQQIRDEFQGRIHLNLSLFSTIARPTTGIQRTSIWGLRTRL